MKKCGTDKNGRPIWRTKSQRVGRFVLLLLMFFAVVGIVVLKKAENDSPTLRDDVKRWQERTR